MLPWDACWRDWEHTISESKEREPWLLAGSQWIRLSGDRLSFRPRRNES